MAPSDRLRCPLLRCGEQFGDHETMLRHLTDCRHLVSGEYVCYECMRVERFSDGKCKCCLGHPGKRRRIINAAKNFFSTLGHKSRKDGTFDFDQEELTLPPPSYDSLEIEQQPPHPAGAEISGTEILEMEAGPVAPVQLDSINYESQQDTQPPRDMISSSMFHSTSSRCTATAAAPDGFQLMQCNNGSRPSLALDTHNIGRPRKVPRTTYLSPSSSLRSTNSSQGVISPISAGSGAWTNESSIHTTLTSPITPFSPDGYDSGSLSRDNSCKFPKDYPICGSYGLYWNESSRTAVAPDVVLTDPDNNYTIDNVSELPGDNPLDVSVPRVWGEDPFLFSFDPRDNYSWSSTVDTEVNVLFTGDDIAPDTGLQYQHRTSGCETKTLVSTTWEALKEHITHSKTNVEYIDNPLARRLKPLSAQHIASKGLASLRSIFDDVDPTDAVDYLCLIHVVYAFSIIIHEDEVSSRCDKLFRQALAYRGFLAPEERDAYSAIVSAIWQPADTERYGLDAPLSRASSLKGKDPELRLDPRTSLKADPLVDVAQNFLDDLEMSIFSGESRPIEVLTSDLWSTHLSETAPDLMASSSAFVITINCIIQMLCHSFQATSQGDDLITNLKAVNQRAAAGCIMTTRRLELELLQAGKDCLASSELFDDFIPQVRGLCDPLYSKHGLNPRIKYHTLGIALIESLIQALDANQSSTSSESITTESTTAFSMDILDGPDPLEEFLENLDKTFTGDDFILPVNTPIETAGEVTVEAVAEEASISATPATHNVTIDPSSLSRNSSDAKTTAATATATATTTTEQETYSGSDLDPTSEIRHITTAEESPVEGSASGHKAAAHSCCDICGYRPKGDPQWFKGSMAKHKKLQHSTDPPKIYKCSYPGCTSAYKNRPDNLRQHQIEKGHFVDDVDGFDGKLRRPSKRKKMD
ncbi:hypothetical protein BJ170DRAFT_612965 [Xylariales sp. AK1849]|nr:hypothetical protein BJ170DRAFT_612965 [Xylariales sp. AK1849]